MIRGDDFMKLIWTTIRVSDMNRSLEFYRDFLGLEIVEDFVDERHRIVMLGSEDETKIELIKDFDYVVEDPGIGVSIGFEPDNYEEMLNNSKDAGFDILGPISPNKNISFFFLKDPDGYTIQLCKRN